MEILPYNPALAEAVTEAYNRACSNVPHCYPITAEEYATAITSTHSEQERGIAQAPQTLILRSSGRILGFATTALRTPSEEQGSPEEGVLRMLWYERGHREAGQALLVAAEEHLRGRELDQIVAFDEDLRLPTYHLPHARLTDRWDHVRGLLGINGHVRVSGEVFLDWQDFESPDPGDCPIDAQVRVERRVNRGVRPNLVVTAHVHEDQVGICTCDCAGEFSRDPRAQDWVFTTWLWVDENLRGRRLGRYLLLRALNEARAEGYVHASISTEWTNYRALLFYGNVGYRAVDWTATYRRGAVNGRI